MIRLIGAALVAAGAAWLGIQAAGELRRRALAVRQAAGGLVLLEGELELGAPPLSRLMARGAARSGGPVKELFQDCLQGLERLEQEEFSALWHRLAEDCTQLHPEARAILASLGDILGRYDAQRQREAISAARRRLEELAGRLEEDSRRQGRVYQTLGLSGGAFLVILLL